MSIFMLKFITVMSEACQDWQHYGSLQKKHGLELLHGKGMRQQHEHILVQYTGNILGNGSQWRILMLLVVMLLHDLTLYNGNGGLTTAFLLCQYCSRERQCVLRLACEHSANDR